MELLLYLEHKSWNKNGNSVQLCIIAQKGWYMHFLGYHVEVNSNGKVISMDIITQENKEIFVPSTSYCKVLHKSSMRMTIIW